MQFEDMHNIAKHKKTSFLFIPVYLSLISQKSVPFRFPKLQTYKFYQNKLSPYIREKCRHSHHLLRLLQEMLVFVNDI